MLTYEPLIVGLEKRLSHDELDEFLTQFHREAKTKFGVERIVTSRVGDLFVMEVGVPFEIREINGQEKVYDVSRRKEISFSVLEKWVGICEAPLPPRGEPAQPEPSVSRDVASRDVAAVKGAVRKTGK